MRARQLTLALLVAIVSADATYAQLTQASLEGTVVDPDGQGIPFSAVAAVHDANGQTRTTQADRTGAFLLAGLPPGTYKVTAESPGFQPVAQDGVRLGVGQTLDVTIELPILTLTETVAVTGTSMRIAASTAARLADTFGRTEIHELPGNLRPIVYAIKGGEAASRLALFLSERDHRIDARGAQRRQQAGAEADGREHEDGGRQ